MVLLYVHDLEMQDSEITCSLTSKDDVWVAFGLGRFRGISLATVAFSNLVEHPLTFNLL